MADMSAFVTLNILLVLISLLIVSASSLFIHKITKSPVKKVIYNFAFIGLSISDIGVALFIAAMWGMQEHYHRNSKSTATHAIPFFNIFSVQFFMPIYNINYSRQNVCNNVGSKIYKFDHQKDI